MYLRDFRRLNFILEIFCTVHDNCGLYIGLSFIKRVAVMWLDLKEQEVKFG